MKFGTHAELHDFGKLVVFRCQKAFLSVAQLTDDNDQRASLAAISTGKISLPDAKKRVGA